MNECFWQKFSRIVETHCKEPGLFYRKPTGNHTDDWIWCERHVGPNKDESRFPKSDGDEHG